MNEALHSQYPLAAPLLEKLAEMDKEGVSLQRILAVARRGASRRASGAAAMKTTGGQSFFTGMKEHARGASAVERARKAFSRSYPRVSKMLGIPAESAMTSRVYAEAMPTATRIRSRGMV